MSRGTRRSLAFAGLFLVAAGVGAFLSDNPLRAGQAADVNLRGQSPLDPATSILHKMNQETQQLYANARMGLVRVYLPPPQWALDLMGKDFAMKRWDLQPNMGRAGETSEQIAKKASQRILETTITPTTQPGTTQPSSTTQPTAEASGFRLVRRDDGSYDLVGGPGGGDERAIIDVSPRSVGFVLDADGHVMLPYYLEERDVGDEELSVMCGDGTVAQATFVGSDKPTNTTILKLDRSFGRPVELVGRRPSDGSLVLFLSSTGESARLQVWTGTQTDTGVVMNVDGTINGFLRQGQFLEAARLVPVVQQIINLGHAKRQLVGVYIREVLPADPLRREHPSLRDRPAVYVVKVQPRSLADQAGIRSGDFIIAIGEETVGDPPTFAAAITSFQGGEAPFTILRDEEVVNVVVKFPRK